MSYEIGMAQNLVEKFHAGQKYGNRPYTDHLYSVYNSVANGSTDERLQVVALLHDILEDTDCTENLLRHLFEDNIVDAVVALSKQENELRGDYLIRVKKNEMARVVKMHDTLCNLKESLSWMDKKRVAKYTDQLRFLVED